MKKRVLLLLFIAVTSLLSAQYSNNNLKVVFDAGAFEVTLPKTWQKIPPTYPYYWVKEYRYKDSSLNSYFKISQYRLSNHKNNSLESIVLMRVLNLKKARRKKFNYTINEVNKGNHFILNTSWKSWENRKSLLKHTAEFIKKGNDLYVIKYSDSTKTTVAFKDDIKNMVSSFRTNRKAKDLLIKKEIPRNQLNEYLQKYTLNIPENWYGFIGETGELQFAPYKLKKNEYTRYRNVLIVKEYDGKEFEWKTLMELTQKRYTQINSTYRRYKTTIKKATHNTYGNYFLIKYSSYIGVRENKRRSAREATVLEAFFVHNKKVFSLTYSFENSFYSRYYKAALKMINSFRIKELN